jgi:hypothetical protein
MPVTSEASRMSATLQTSPVEKIKLLQMTTSLPPWRVLMNDPDNDVQLLLVEQLITEVEQRLRLLKHQIVAMSSENTSMDVHSELLFSTFRALRSLKSLRHEILDDAAKPLENSAR